MGQLKSCVEGDKVEFRDTELVHISLKEEILELHKQLKDQLMIRSELEKGTKNRPLVITDHAGDESVSKPAQDLIREISVLELEVAYLEKYLLSLYRKTFHKTQPSLSAREDTFKANSATNESSFSEVPRHSVIVSDELKAQTPLGSCIHRSQSSLCQDSSASSFGSPSKRTVSQRVDLYHSLPLSMLERRQNDFRSVSQGEQPGSGVSDHVPLEANRLSEEMIKCISEIYCQLADPPLFNPAFLSSPISFSSPLSEPSPRNQYGVWSVNCEGKSSFDPWLNNPFKPDASKEFSGSIFRTVEVHGLCRDSQKFCSIEHMQRKFKILVSQLEEVDPRKLKHEEKLAFWINVHNALVMHAFVVYGIPCSTLKRISLALKAAYNIGGHIISVGSIQSTILQCSLPRPGQWFQSLLYPKPKLKAGDARKGYGTEHPQPLLQFALSLGSHSDPMVRLYTPKNVFQELEVAKEEYIHTNFRVSKDQKILLPKIVGIYVKGSDLSPDGLMSMITHSMPDCMQKSFQQILKRKPLKKIEWIPHNFTFRYLLSPDLTK